MRCFYIGAFRFPYFDAAAARVLNIGKSLRQCGHDVEFIAMGGNQEECHRQKDGNYVYQGFPYIITNELDCRSGLLKKIRMKLCRGNRTIKELCSKELSGSLVIVYNPSNMFLGKLIKLSKVRNFKLAVDLTEWYDRNELPITDWYSYTHCMSRTMQLVKNKIVISSYLDNYYTNSNNIVIPATCDSNDAKWQKDTNSINSYDGITLIYAGNPVKKDLVHTAINAVNHLSKEGYAIRFLILGITKENYIKRYSNKLDCQNLSDNIVFVGKVSQNDVPAYYKHADYMILLRRDNRKSNAGFPTKFAEAMTAGVPVIANATSDIGRYIENDVNGYMLKNESIDCVENTLRTICKGYSPQIISQQKNNALKTGREVFDYTNYVQPLRIFIHNLL